MSRLLISFLIVIFLLLSACGARGPEVTITRSDPTPMPTTSAGTPISKNFHTDVDMIATPNSTCFSAIGWGSGTGTLVVTFRDSGASYAYDEVPRKVWDALRSADSMGGYYNREIKGQYDCTRIEK